MVQRSAEKRPRTRNLKKKKSVSKSKKKASSSVKKRVSVKATKKKAIQKIEPVNKKRGPLKRITEFFFGKEELPVKKAYDESITYTKIDALMALIKRDKQISARKAARILKVKTKQVEEWARALDAKDKLSLEYSLLGDLIIKVKK